MIRIGDFSALTRLSIKTLRYYDETGLLRPVRVDPSSGYRYYSPTQLPRLYRILALKDLGFALDQIARILDAGVSAEELRGMLRLRQAEQEARVVEEAGRLARLQMTLRLIDKENIMSQDVVLKEVAPQWIASVRTTIPKYSDVGPLYPEVFGYLGSVGLSGLPVALWHDPEFKESDVDAEAGVFIPRPVEPKGRIQVRELPAASVASIIHAGAFNRLTESYNALGAWIAGSGYTPAGPAREIYLKCTAPVTQDNESYITELQIPVVRSDTK